MSGSPPPFLQKVYCGHEYSVQNLKFAAHVEPDNPYLTEKMEWCKEQRGKSPPEPTIPSTIGKIIAVLQVVTTCSLRTFHVGFPLAGEEKHYNPFMRVTKDSVQKHAKKEGDAVGTMAALREEKDNFKGK